jgi:hypothetical protein
MNIGFLSGLGWWFDVTIIRRQRMPSGKVKAQLLRPASGGIGGKGAARRTIASAVLSSSGEPELLAMLRPASPPEAVTVKETRTSLRALPRADPEMPRDARRSLAATLPG